jgi:D-alanyl-D-alanine carboxypeptidase
MTEWLNAALGHIPRWLDYQVQHHDQPGCAVAIAHGGEIVLEQAFGVANRITGERLTPRHRFRVASHSKTFTAAGILKLKDLGRLRLDDNAGSFVQGLHPDVAAVTIQQLLSHSAGLVRDGADSGQFSDRRPFRSAPELLADLSVAQPIVPAERFKYSNHGFGLLGLIIEAVTKEPYTAWIMREIVAPAGLEETAADIGLATGPLASGHSTRLPLGRRLAIPGDNPTNDVASATGFVSTAADLAKFFAQLAPQSRSALLTSLSRREITRRHWRDAEPAAQERYYGLGTISGSLKSWDWFGHSGSFQGTLSRTAVFPIHDIAVSVLTNAVDGPAQAWVDGITHLLQAFHAGGAPSAEVADWVGRWWTLWGPVDLVPIGGKVLASSPVLNPPLVEANEIAVIERDAGKVTRATGFASPGETVRRVRGADGEVTEIWIGGGRLASEQDFAREILARYQRTPEKK